MTGFGKLYMIINELISVCDGYDGVALQMETYRKIDKVVIL